jgi:hypothetical protein
MTNEDYGTMELEDDSASFEPEDYDRSDADDVLDALMESANEYDLAERKRKRGAQRGAQRGAARGQRPVPTANGRNAYREPGAASPNAPVNQKQLKDALAQVATDVRRNAEGIKTINGRLGALDGRVSGVIGVAAAHGQQIAKLDRQLKIDGAFEFVESFNGTQVDVYQLLKGAVKSGFLGAEGKGVFSNPAVLGGIGLLLRNPSILRNITGAGGP